MEIIKVTEDRINRVLPSNIIESNDLSNDSKKVLATIINYIFVQAKAKKEGFLVITNDTLQKSVSISKRSMMNAIQELIDCRLIERKAGKAWQKGNAKTASEYYVNWKALNEPIKKMNFEEIYQEFLKESKSPEMPIRPTITIPISNSIPIDVSIHDTVSVSNPLPLPETDSITVNTHVHKKHNKNNNPCNTTTQQNNLCTSTTLNYEKIEKSIEYDKHIAEKGFQEWVASINKMDYLVTD